MLGRSLCAGGSRSLVYWFRPTRPLRAGGRPVFLWEAFGGGGCSGGGGAIKTVEVALVPLPPLADAVLNRGSGEGSDSAKASS